jgi:hypothetical protein
METSTITPYSAIRIAAPDTKGGKMRAGWIVVDNSTGRRVHFVWQYQRGADELHRFYAPALIRVIAGLSVTVREYERVLREFGQ